MVLNRVKITVDINDCQIIYSWDKRLIGTEVDKSKAYILVDTFVSVRDS